MTGDEAGEPGRKPLTVPGLASDQESITWPPVTGTAWPVSYSCSTM